MQPGFESWLWYQGHGLGRALWLAEQESGTDPAPGAQESSRLKGQEAGSPDPLLLEFRSSVLLRPQFPRGVY